MTALNAVVQAITYTLLLYVNFDIVLKVNLEQNEDKGHFALGLNILTWSLLVLLRRSCQLSNSLYSIAALYLGSLFVMSYIFVNGTMPPSSW